MTLFQLLLYIAVAAVVLTVIVKYAFKKSDNLFMSFLQNYCGALFIVSGWVKAVDPMGTSFKMQQYFAEFQSTFEGTWMSFIAPLFPLLSSMSLGFSVFMIVFEIALGVMLILGAWRKLTAWLFFLLVAFFTVLTGYTYLTGYVPQFNADGSVVNFFEFSKWGDWVESNMKVTDCGCFGDFIKLKPYTSFLKDVALMIPAFIFLFGWKQKHELFTGSVRSIIVGLATVGTFVFCLNNYMWNLPVKDFRPFSVGKDVRTQRAAELESMQNVQVIGYKFSNSKTGEVHEVPYSADNYQPFVDARKKYKEEDGFKIEQIKTKPERELTKIADFTVEGEKTITTEYLLYENKEGEPMEVTPQDTVGGAIGPEFTFKSKRSETSSEKMELTEEILNDPNYSFMVVCYKLYEGDTGWDENYVKRFTNKVNPIAVGADKAGQNFYAVVGGATEEKIGDFRHTAQTAFPFYTADDILLKTIVRSNPGVVLWKDGVIVDKWHHTKLPSYEEIKAKHGF